jgi:hypothetical protein
MDFKSLLQKEWVRYVLVLVAGITIGALFYPTKQIEEKLSLKYEQTIASINEKNGQELEKQNSKYEKLQEEFNSYQSQAETKISSLTKQISNLKSKSKEKYVKIIHPDGTVEIRKDTENESSSETTTVTQVEEEYKQKIETLNKQWESTVESKTSELKKEFSSKEQQYEKTIQDLKSSKTVSVNSKRFGIDVGIMSDKSYYGGVNADLWGPLYLNLEANINTPESSNKVGAGVGIRF